MNEFLKAARKMSVKRFYNTNGAINKALEFTGASALILVGLKLLLNSIGDLSSGEALRNMSDNNFKPRR